MKVNKPTLLELLGDNDGSFVSGEEISRKLNVSRTAVWKQIRKLEAEGYAIEAVPKLGYRIIGRPSVITVHDLLPKLTTRVFGRHVKVLEAVPSTQDELRHWAEAGAPEGALVIAETQTSGRGRMGRTWVSPPGKGVWMSLLLRPAVPLPLTPQLTLLAAVALTRAIARLHPSLPIGIKWPNDLLVNGKKISGILLESAAEDERLRYVVVGIGISANLDRADFPEELLEKVASLKMVAGGVETDRASLVAAVLEEFESLYDLYREQGFSPIRALWEARAVTLGREVTLPTASGVNRRGIARELDETGGLVVEFEDGTVQTVFSGEVS